MIEETGSFRDPAGKIFYHKNKVLRKLSESGKERFDFLIKEEILNKSIEKKFLIKTKIFEDDDSLKNKDNNLILKGRLPIFSAKLFPVKNPGTLTKTSCSKFLGATAVFAISLTALNAVCLVIGILFARAAFIKTSAALSATALDTGLVNIGIKDLF